MREALKEPGRLLLEWGFNLMLGSSVGKRDNSLLLPASHRK